MALAGNRATALALVSRELLQNALEHGGESVESSWRGETARSCWRSQTTARVSKASRRRAPGLSIVRALVRDELGGTLSLESNGGLRAEVVFPA